MLLSWCRPSMAGLRLTNDQIGAFTAMTPSLSCAWCGCQRLMIHLICCLFLYLNVRLRLLVAVPHLCLIVCFLGAVPHPV
jgi:hypothetical protein